MHETMTYPARVDVAIVGSGPTGAACARILSEQAPGAVVAMFEVGPTVSDPPGRHVKNLRTAEAMAEAQRRSEGPGAGAAATVSSPAAVTAGQRRGRAGTYLLEDGYQVEGEDGLPVVAFSSNVGGMGAHWTAACPTPGGAERIDFLDDFDDLLSESRRLLGVTSTAFDGAPYAALVRERLAAVVDAGRAPGRRVQPMPLAVHRRDDGGLEWSGSDVVFGDVTRANPNFSLFDESLVTRVILEEGRATGVEVRCLRTDAVSVVEADAVVVAADALRTPQVLWASDVRPEALGRTLNDQTQIVYAARIRDAALTEAGAGRASGPLDEHSGVSWVPYTDDMPFHGQIMQLDASPVALAEDDPASPGSIIGLGLFCAKDLRWEDRVEFTDASDAYGMPAMRIRYSLTDVDHERLDAARLEIRRLADAIGEPLGDEPFTLPLGSSLHYQGTTRMGATDDGRSVCGPDGEVWGTSGLFVAGNGVIPTPMACNPTLTSVALAIRAASRIAKRFSPAD